MRKLSPLLAILGAVLSYACSDTTRPSASPQFSRQISFNDLQTTLMQLPVGGAARVKIELPPGGLVAREVKVKDPEEVNEDERVESRITNLVVSGTQGTLTLEPGFTVTFTQDTKFEGSGAELTFQQFVDQVTAALAMNPQQLLPVEARRTPANPAVLAPGDPFPAARLDLQDMVGGPELRLNVTAANLVAAGSGDCQSSLSATLKGCLQVLGLTVGIDATTELEAMLPGMVETKFEGVLDCATLQVAGPHEGSFSLAGQNTTIQVVAATRIEFESGDEEKLSDLTAVKTACDATPPQMVEVEGESVAGMTAGTLVATEVQFKVEQQALQGAVEFRGEVSSVDVGQRTVAVATDAGPVTVHVAGDNLIDPEGDLTTLQAVQDAVTASPPQRVRAEGRANAGSTAGSPLEATVVKFQIEH